MKIKRYVAQNLQFAIRKVKAELGEDAIILNTKRRKKGGFFGLFGREVVEITAAVPDSPGGRLHPVPGPPPSPSPLKKDETAMLTVLQNELDEIKTMVAGLSSKGLDAEQMEGGLFKAYHVLAAFNNLLVQNEVTAENAAALVKRVITALPEEGLQDYQQVKETLLEIIAADLQGATPLMANSPRQRIVALVGPTGVGKTTTVAKMAAQSALLQKREVALITADTYRIAAVEQLRRYAEIIDVPLEVILGADELQKVLGRHRDKNLILIDTAGRSQRNVVQLSELRNILDPSTQIETVLVLSLTTKYRDLLDISTKFQRVNYDALLFTKLDETTSYGSILNIVKATGKPLTYVTTGQNVPDDIEAAEPAKIAKMILGES